MEKSEIDSLKSYQVFRGLQRPLKFLIFDGRYIGWAVAVAGISLVGFIVSFIFIGMAAAFVYLFLSLGLGSAKIFLARHKGIYNKKEYKGIYMFVHLSSAFSKDKW